MRSMGISYHALPYASIKEAKAAAQSHMDDLDKQIDRAANMSDEQHDAIRLRNSLATLADA